jgi:hypothetical protein
MEYMIEIHFPEVESAGDMTVERVERVDVEKADFVPAIGDEFEVDSADRQFRVWGRVVDRWLGFVVRNKARGSGSKVNGPLVVIVHVAVESGHLHGRQIKAWKWVGDANDG